MSTITARQKILAFLRRRGMSTAVQIGHALNLSAPTVRHHLSILRADGRVVSDGPVPGTARGRPKKAYRLSDQLLGDNSALLAGAMLESCFDGLSAAARDAAIKDLAERLGGRLGKPDTGLPALKRLVQLTERLTSMHYEAGWEAGAQGPRVLFGHCPFAALIEEHPELCQLDSQMLEHHLGAQVVQLSKIGRRPGAATHCVFAVSPGTGGQPKAI